MRRSVFFFPALIGMLAICSSAHAGAWLQPKGEGLAITQLTHFSSSQYWNNEGTLQPQDRFAKWEIQPYAEYGLTDHITIGGTAYLQHNTQAGVNNDGIADPEFFLRRSLWHDDKTVVSIQPLIKLPGRFTKNDSPPRGGSKSTDLELSLLYGRSLNIVSNRDYADIRLGMRGRNQGLHGQFKADAAIGISPWEHWQFIPAIRYLEATKIDDATPFAQTGDLDYDLLKTELTVAYKLPSGNWVQATYFDHLDGRQTGDGSGVSLGYAVRF